MSHLSKITYLFCAFSILYFGILYYPKWEKADTEATIGWDVSGYYVYLPSTIIYSDIKEAKFLDSIIVKYHPTPSKMQGFYHRSGNFVFKYPMGQAIQFLPWFLIGHLFAIFTGFETDGFSIPYQLAISLGSLLIALIGLWVVRKVLLQYFSDKTTSISILFISLGTNYLNYASIDNAMTHNWLFTCYALLLYATIEFYKSPSIKWAVIIGALCGWATLTRPSEIVILILPIAWGLTSISSIPDRLRFFCDNRKHLIFSLSVFLAFGLLQPLYWKYVAGEWIVYSYEDQGFSWSHPHLMEVLFSYRAGWLTYSPIMVFSIIGFIALRKIIPELFLPIILYFLVNLYIVSSWDIWWYGGSLGMRALVQSYAVLSLPLAAFIEFASKNKKRLYLVATFGSILIWLNMWWTIQAHKPNGAFASEQMTKSFFWQVIGRNYFNSEWLKLLDTDEIYSSNKRNDVKALYENDFEADTTIGITPNAISGKHSLLLSSEKQFSPEIILDLKNYNKDWIRVGLRFSCQEKEWDFWKMTQLIVRFKNGDSIVKESAIRLQRHVENNEVKYIYFDVKAPINKSFDKLSVIIWNGESKKSIFIDDLAIEGFNGI